MTVKHKSFRDKKLKTLLKKYNNIEKKLMKDGYIGCNKIVAELGEWFVLNCFRGMEEADSKINKGWDLKDRHGKRVQVKTRRIRPNRKGPPVFRPFHTKIRRRDFDYALLVILDLDYWIKEIWKVPYKVIKKYQIKRKTDSVDLSDKIMNHKEVKCYKFC